MRLELPFPPPALAPNANLSHWGQRSRARKDYRTKCGMLALVAKAEHTRRYGTTWPLKAIVRIDLQFVLPDHRHRDPDNLVAMFKSGIDALVDAKLLPGDSQHHVRLGSPQVAYGRPAKVVLLLTEMGGDEPVILLNAKPENAPMKISGGRGVNDVNKSAGRRYKRPPARRGKV